MKLDIALRRCELQKGKIADARSATFVWLCLYRRLFHYPGNVSFPHMSGSSSLGSNEPNGALF